MCVKERGGPHDYVSPFEMFPSISKNGQTAVQWLHMPFNSSVSISIIHYKVKFSIFESISAAGLLNTKDYLCVYIDTYKYYICITYTHAICTCIHIWHRHTHEINTHLHASMHASIHTHINTYIHT